MVYKHGTCGYVEANEKIKRNQTKFLSALRSVKERLSSGYLTFIGRCSNFIKGMDRFRANEVQ